MRRFQFRLSTLLWITLAVACFFGGMKFERWRGEWQRHRTEWELIDLLDTGPILSPMPQEQWDHLLKKQHEREKTQDKP